MRVAEAELRPWVIRHRKPRHLPGRTEAPSVNRREVLTGAGIREDVPLPGNPGLEVDGESLLPFLLAARAQIAVASATKHGRSRRAVFAEGLASSYEAYLETRCGDVPTDDDGDSDNGVGADSQEVAWYLSYLDRVLPAQRDDIRSRHPKVFQTINRAIQLWWKGEKSLIFCHYRATGRALRRYVSLRMEEELINRAAEKLGVTDRDEVRLRLTRLGEQFFDVDRRLRARAEDLLRALVRGYPQFAEQEAVEVVEVALRFLRTPSFLVRYFPLAAPDPPLALTDAFGAADASGLTLRQKLEKFCEFLATRCESGERGEYLTALGSIQTGTFRREAADPEDPTDEVRYLPNVRLANGEVQPEQRRRIMLAFNTPFFPEVLIASSVLGEGVDLQLDCRFVIHHDLSWNPSVVEQRTGRVDRIGAKAEKAGKPIHVYLPFVTGTQDEKMFRVVQDRERWFSVVMGEKFQVDEQTTDRLAERAPFPEEAARRLAFDLSLSSDG
jgi:ERCC4-related helicase